MQDPAMRNMLRQATRRSPGIVHYYVRYCRDSVPGEREQKEIRDTNFDLFNVVTLFLGESEIPVLLDLIAAVPSDEFEDLCAQTGVATRFLHYVTGPVSVGKTTVLSRLQGVTVVDEWLTQRTPLIAKPSTQLTQDERNEVDEWIIDQLRRKNARYSGASLGLHVMDRAPFPRPFRSGALIILTCRSSDLEDRQRWRGRAGTADYIEVQQRKLLETYAVQGARGCRVVDTTGLAIDAVVKLVMYIIHIQPYEEYRIDARLQEFLEPSH
jgi:hypothetical protein